MSEKRLAVVTGAARGIGKAVVLELLAQGREVAGIDLNADNLKELEQVCKDAGYNVITKCCDITNTEEFKGILDGLISEYGGIAILVNNAGITRDGLMIRLTEQDFDLVINVNLKAAYMATKIAVQSMLRQKFGRIVNLSSVSGVMGNPGQTNYSASKAGLIGMTKSLAREVAKKGITVNCIAPGFIETEMTSAMPDSAKKMAKDAIPARKLGQTSDIAKAIAYLTSDDTGYVTGQVLAVDGGMSM